MSEFLGDGYEGFDRVSEAPLDAISTASPTSLPSNGTLLKGDGPTIWIMQGGELFQFANMTQFANDGYTMSEVVTIPDGALDGFPSGGTLPCPC